MEKLKIGLDKKIVIGYDDLAYSDHIQQSSEKLEILGDGVREFKKLFDTDIADMAEFEISFYDYALNYARTKYSGAAVLGLHDDQFLKLYNLDLQKLKNIDARYLIQRGSLICVKNIFNIDNLDFRVFAENEYEVNKLNDCLELIKAVENVYSKYFIDRCSIQQINHFINKIYVTKPDGTGIEPNRFWIKQL